MRPYRILGKGKESTLVPNNNGPKHGLSADYSANDSPGSELGPAKSGTIVVRFT